MFKLCCILTYSRCKCVWGSAVVWEHVSLQMERCYNMLYELEGAARRGVLYRSCKHRTTVRDPSTFPPWPGKQPLSLPTLSNP